MPKRPPAVAGPAVTRFERGAQEAAIALSVRDGHWDGDVITRIRALLRKAELPVNVRLTATKHLSETVAFARLVCGRSRSDLELADNLPWYLR